MRSWLDGGVPASSPGDRLGLPTSGRGSVARAGRRLAALAVDWFMCLLISAAFFPGTASTFWLTRGDSFATLGVFALENLLLVGTLGHSFGHRVLGLRVLRVVPGGAGEPPVVLPRPPGFGRAFVRTLLLCLVVPAAIWDADGRGLHDKAAGTVLVRR